MDDIFKTRMISIVICCHNSAQRLPRTISAIRRAKLSSVRELIIVDNNSVDETLTVAQNSVNSFPIPIRCISEARQGLAFARATAVRHCTGSVISFLDDDNEVFPDWFVNVAAAFEEDKRIGAVGGKILPPSDSCLPSWFSSVSGNFAVGEQAPTSGFVTKTRMLLWGAGLSVRREAIGDFYDDPDRILLVGRMGSQLLAGDDTELCYGIVLRGYELYYNDKIILRHNFDTSRLSLFYLIRLNIGFGRARYRLFPYHKLLDKGRISHFPKLHSRFGMTVLGLADLAGKAMRLLVSPSAKSLGSVANAWGYLAEVSRSKPAAAILPEQLS